MRASRKSHTEHETGGEQQGSAPVVVGRLLLLLAAAAALTAGTLLARARDRARAQAERTRTVLFLCPMHPEVSSPLPGDCPICGMALERPSSPTPPPSEMGRSRRVAEVERRILTQTVRAPAWRSADRTVTAILHEDDLVGCAAGEGALYFPHSTPADARPARLLSTTGRRWDAGTVAVEFTVADGRTVPGGTGWLELASRPRPLLMVPESAVLYGGEGAYVLAAPAGGHTFEHRSITIGRILDSGHVADSAGDRFGGVVVLAGLQEGEQVVFADTFFLDAERRLRIAQGRPAEVIE